MAAEACPAQQTESEVCVAATKSQVYSSWTGAVRAGMTLLPPLLLLLQLNSDRWMVDLLRFLQMDDCALE